MAKKKGTNSVTFVILLLLIFGLAGFGVTNFGGATRNVATVGNVDVGVNDYARAVDAQIRQFETQMGQRLTFQQAQAFGLDRAALGRLITEAALANEAQEIGLSVGDENVSQEIQNAPAFRDVSGEFSREVYEMSLERTGVNADDFEAQIRSDIAEGILRRAVAGGLQVPDIYAEVLFAYARETRDVTWARLTASDLSEPLAAPSDADLAAYHEANSDAFMRPETKVIEYAWLSPDMLAENVEVSEDQIRALYDGNIDEYVQPERRLVERLVFSSDAQATDAKTRLDAGQVTFDDLVAERGLELSDIDMGDVTSADLGTASDAVFALTEPGVVGPLASDLGPALFRMNGVLAAQETTYEDARADLRIEAASDRARRIIQDSITQVEDLLAGGADMALLAERTDMETGSIDWNVDALDGIAAYAAFRRAAAAARPGDFAEVIEFDDGSIAALTVKEVQPAALRPLDEVMLDVAQAWTVQKTQTALEKDAEVLAEQIRQGSDIAELELNLETGADLGRDAFVEGTPPDFIETVFQLDAGDVAVLSADGDAWIIRLDTIVEPDQDTEEAQASKAAFSAQVSAEIAVALSGAYTRALTDQAGVELNQAAMNAVNTQLQ